MCAEVPEVPSKGASPTKVLLSVLKILGSKGPNVVTLPLQKTYCAFLVHVCYQCIHRADALFGLFEGLGGGYVI